MHPYPGQIFWPTAPAPYREPDRYLVGLSLGTVTDPTGLAVLRRTPSVWSPEPEKKVEAAYQLVGLKRYPAATSYPAILAHLKELLEREPLSAPETRLVLDFTGCGGPVGELFTAADLCPTLAVITTGTQTLQAPTGEWRVAKMTLAGVLQVLLQSGRLRIAERLPEAETLTAELLAFKVKPQAQPVDTFETWREGERDDLVLAVGLAGWLGEKGQSWATDPSFLRWLHLGQQANGPAPQQAGGQKEPWRPWALQPEPGDLHPGRPGPDWVHVPGKGWVQLSLRPGERW
jgi:hypothetical protein